MRPVALGNPPFNATTDQKIDWCIRAIQEIARASHLHDPNVYADAYTTSNTTTTRTLNADSTTLAEVADVLNTFIEDHQKRGQKQIT